MKKIALTKSKVALVDDNDFEELSQFKWCVTQKSSGYYAQRRSWDSTTKKGKIVYMARQIMRAGPREIVDHINGDTLDNRRNNLRIVNKSLNALNSKQRKSASGFRGVRKQSTGYTYMAMIKFNGQKIYLGNFRSPSDAAHAYNKAALKLIGPKAKLNSVEKETI